MICINLPTCSLRRQNLAKLTVLGLSYGSAAVPGLTDRTAFIRTRNNRELAGISVLVDCLATFCQLGRALKRTLGAPFNDRSKLDVVANWPQRDPHGNTKFMSTRSRAEFWSRLLSSSIENVRRRRRRTLLDSRVFPLQRPLSLRPGPSRISGRSQLPTGPGGGRGFFYRFFIRQ